MLASTVQFSRYGRVTDPWPSRTRKPAEAGLRAVRWGSVPVQRRPDLPMEGASAGPEVSKLPKKRPVPSGPNSVPRRRRPVPRSTQLESCCTCETFRPAPNGQCSTLEPHPRGIRPEHESGQASRRNTCQVLLRKEVIQPHLPVRLPCYDFVPIADPTFDGSFHKG